MTTGQQIALGGAVALGIISLLAAFVAWRALGRAGAGMRALDASVTKAASTMPERMANARLALNRADSLTERALWSVSGADARIDTAGANLRARRDASDRLRARLKEGRTTLSRLRETVRALMRLNDIRRNFWA